MIAAQELISVVVRIHVHHQLRAKHTELATLSLMSGYHEAVLASAVSIASADAGYQQLVSDVNATLTNDKTNATGIPTTIGDGTIIQKILAFLESPLGKAVIAIIIALLTGV